MNDITAEVERALAENPPLWFQLHKVVPWLRALLARVRELEKAQPPTVATFGSISMLAENAALREQLAATNTTIERLAIERDALREQFVSAQTEIERKG